MAHAKSGALPPARSRTLRARRLLTTTTVLTALSCSQGQTGPSDDPSLGTAGVALSYKRKRQRQSVAEEMLSNVPTSPDLIGKELSSPVHMQNGDEFSVSLSRLIEHGRDLFIARWTVQEGQGRPFGKGNDQALTDPASPLLFPHNFNRVSGPASGSCSGCHNQPRIGGGGDIAGSVFVLGNRFDFLTFDPTDTTYIRGRLDERGVAATFQSASNQRKTTGMFGSGYIEMLARQMTEELRTQAAACGLGETCPLETKSVSFGFVTHESDGTWATGEITGLPPKSMTSIGQTPPTLIVQPFFQSGAVISLREFTLNSYARLHGVQAEERFGTGVDQDGDGHVNELTIADVTAVTLFQATLPVPGQVIPTSRSIERAIVRGEMLFHEVGCTSCHVPALPLVSSGSTFSEPNPYNPPNTLQLAEVERAYELDLNDQRLPQPRLEQQTGVTLVPAYTDLKLHDITSGLPSCAADSSLEPFVACDPDVEAISQHFPTEDDRFFEGNGLFLTRRLWGISNQHAFGHHGQYTTLAEAILAHRGEATQVLRNYAELSESERREVIEFLKSLQVLPGGTRCTIIDERGNCRRKPRR